MSQWVAVGLRHAVNLEFLHLHCSRRVDLVLLPAVIEQALPRLQKLRLDG